MLVASYAVSLSIWSSTLLTWSTRLWIWSPTWEASWATVTVTVSPTAVPAPRVTSTPEKTPVNELVDEVRVSGPAVMEASCAAVVVEPPSRAAPAESVRVKAEAVPVWSAETVRR